MPFALLEMANSQRRELVAPKSAGEQRPKNRPIPFALHLPAVWRLPKSLPLLGGQPVAKPYSQFLYALDSPYPGDQVCAEEPAVGRLVRKTAHRAETKVDGARNETASLQVHRLCYQKHYAFAYLACRGIASSESATRRIPQTRH